MARSRIFLRGSSTGPFCFSGGRGKKHERFSSRRQQEERSPEARPQVNRPLLYRKRALPLKGVLLPDNNKGLVDKWAAYRKRRPVSQLQQRNERTYPNGEKENGRQGQAGPPCQGRCQEQGFRARRKNEERQAALNGFERHNFAVAGSRRRTRYRRRRRTTRPRTGRLPHLPATGHAGSQRGGVGLDS